MHLSILIKKELKELYNINGLKNIQETCILKKVTLIKSSFEMSDSRLRGTKSNLSIVLDGSNY